MIIPIFIPIIYCWRWKNEGLRPVLLVAFLMLLIVFLYMPIIWNLNIPYIGYAIGKFILFVFIPLGIFYWYLRDGGVKGTLAVFGVRKEGMKKSLLLCLMLMPIMFIVTAVFSSGAARSANPLFSTIMFVEAFTEEFFFRGILFLYLWDKTDIRVAYMTSILSFTLLHPQYFFTARMIPVIVQGILTAVIAHRSRNITGAWTLHGANRVFGLSILPFLR
jgi:membrane protease YdiL (CAAX protease family)